MCGGGGILKKVLGIAAPILGTALGGPLGGALGGGIGSALNGGSIGQDLIGAATGGIGAGLSGTAGSLFGEGGALSGTGAEGLNSGIISGLSPISSGLSSLYNYAGNGISDAANSFGQATGLSGLFDGQSTGSSLGGDYASGLGGNATTDSGTNAARGAASNAATSTAGAPLSGYLPATGSSSIGGGQGGGFVNLGNSADTGFNGINTDSLASAGSGASPGVSALTNSFASGISNPDTSAAFGTGVAAGVSPSAIGGKGVDSTLASLFGGNSSGGGSNQMINGALRSLITGLTTNTNQAGYQGENAAAQQAAQAYQSFLNSGTQANQTLADLYGNNGQAAQQSAQGNFTNTPGYQFARDQGINALDASAAARGGLLSGNQAKAVQDYGTGLANQTYQQYVNNLQNQAGLGANAAGGYGSALAGGANALAQGGQAKANNQNQMYGGVANSLFPGNDILSLLMGKNGGGNGGLLSSLFG